ncbi:hypothetical protein KSS87_018398 [Heliosperma pusillum]|nr:hypothetical protein KSS87_018398 [Heliosperma pusillum]
MDWTLGSGEAWLNGSSQDAPGGCTLILLLVADSGGTILLAVDRGGIYEKFANAFSKAVRELEVGNGFGDGVVQFSSCRTLSRGDDDNHEAHAKMTASVLKGPLINEAAVQKVEKFVEDAISKGAKVLLGGSRHHLGMTFFEPTVMTGVNSEMLLSRDEIFGPVAPLLPFKTEEEAIHMANDTNAGLAAYIFTTNIQRSWRVTEALEYGIVGVNEGLVSTEVAPFGGFKQSGIGREGSKYGMDEYLEIFVSFDAAGSLRVMSEIAALMLARQLDHVNGRLKVAVAGSLVTKTNGRLSKQTSSTMLAFTYISAPRIVARIVADV